MGTDCVPPRDGSISIGPGTNGCGTGRIRPGARAMREGVRSVRCCNSERPLQGVGSGTTRAPSAEGWAAHQCLMHRCRPIESMSTELSAQTVWRRGSSRRGTWVQPDGRCVRACWLLWPLVRAARGEAWLAGWIRWRAEPPCRAVFADFLLLRSFVHCARACAVCVWVGESCLVVDVEVGSVC